MPIYISILRYLGYGKKHPLLVELMLCWSRGDKSNIQREKRLANMAALERKEVG